LGLVGNIVSVDPSSVLDLLDSGRIPVISSVAPNVDNPEEVLNVNADIAAGELTTALKALKLMILTDVPGLLENYPDPSTLISRIGTERLATLIPTLETGMIPKMTSCLNAVHNGARGAHIIDGRQPHSLLLETFTSAGIGTLIVPGNEYLLESDLDDRFD
jgi:acetylglutamate kinase